MAKQPNYYRILGITPLASESEVKYAYRALAKRYHPDTMPPERREWARIQMARINAAYRVLQDPEQRARYNLERGYTWSRLGVTDLDPRAAPTTSTASNDAIWHRQRARERLRRQRAEKWRIAGLVCGAALVVGVLLTLLFVRTLRGYMIAAVLNACLLSLSCITLFVANR